MANVEKVIIVAVVVLCVASSVLCEGDSEVQESRTFGHHFLKRISFALIPAAFVVGMITTLLGALTVVSIKGLGVGLILLILTIGQMIARSLPAALPLSPPPYSAHPVAYPYWK